ncbi:MAG: OB-fold nucleic acid binding domain-containing protein [Candidatus Woesearchaeota archaeon]|jgi:hypothetical protein|nr:OB-fold nucleic acid binding domain-containing protein [Candidatus Woesearchaeota archaeon]
MTEKEKLLQNLIDKSGKSSEEISSMIAEKVNELSGLISDEGAIYIIANDLGVRLDSERPKKDAELAKIEDITEPKTPVSFICKIIRKYDLVTFSTEKNPQGRVQSMLVGDETGITRLVFWGEKTELLDSIHDGDVLKVLNAYTRENTNQERIEVHYGQYSDIEVNPKDVKIELKEFVPQEIVSKEKKINELEEGDRNIKLSGIVTDFEIPRFYLGCPECFKKVFQDEGIYKCAEHEEVKALRIPIVNIVFDDGESTISIVGFRDRAENLTKLKDIEIIGLTEDIDKYRDFSKKMIGSKLEIVGNVGLNNMTGDKQFLVNQVLSVEFTTVEDTSNQKIAGQSETSSDRIVKKEESKPAAKEEKVEEVDIDDNLDDIEEIDIDDDLL